MLNLVLGIIACAIFLGYTYYKTAKRNRENGTGCSGSCGGCQFSKDCSRAEKKNEK